MGDLQDSESQVLVCTNMKNVKKQGNTSLKYKSEYYMRRD